MKIQDDEVQGISVAVSCQLIFLLWGRYSDIYRWKKPLNQPSSHPFEWDFPLQCASIFLVPRVATLIVAMCSLEAMDVLQQQHLMVMRALEMLAVFL